MIERRTHLFIIIIAELLMHLLLELDRIPIFVQKAFICKRRSTNFIDFLKPILQLKLLRNTFRLVIGIICTHYIIVECLGWFYVSTSFLLRFFNRFNSASFCRFSFSFFSFLVSRCNFLLSSGLLNVSATFRE